MKKKTADNFPPRQNLTPKQKKLAEAIAAEGLAIQDRFRPEPLYKLTGKGHYDSHTVEEIRKAKENPSKNPTK